MRCVALKVLRLSLLMTLFWACLPCGLVASEAPRGVRQVLGDLILGQGEGVELLVKELGTYSEARMGEWIAAWRQGEFHSLQTETGRRILRQLADGSWIDFYSETVVAPTQDELARMVKERPARQVRRALKHLEDISGLLHPSASKRIEAAMALGLSQNPEYLEVLRLRLDLESESAVRVKLEEALAISLFANGDAGEQLLAVQRLGELASVTARDLLRARLTLLEQTAPESPLADACQSALKRIAEREKRIVFMGNFFRGLSLGSVLLIVSFGLAITFGLMGVINMAHGEFIAIGGYTTYLIQKFFMDQWGVNSPVFSYYFWLALPMSFLAAAGVGFLMERGVIRFLYRRPLESLLCTWGISMIMQQAFRLIFGAANVQVNTPSWLMNNLSVGGFDMSYTRLLILVVALVVVVCTWLLLAKTSLGLHIRAVMQNRNMAAALGIPVKVVNARTFALGCGLAGLGGCVLSQIGNVGPSMGQSYIVDSFIVVVIGSVGNLLGAGVSAMGIGMLDQYLQPSLGPVMGKITVFFLVILFLQWKPGGLFPTRSRSLDD
jgi:urea transport system permease protein